MIARALLVMCFFAFFKVPLITSQIIRYNAGDPLRLGVGYNTLTGEYAGKCTVDVLADDIRPAGSGEANIPGQSAKWELTSEQDLSSLAEKLDFSASASANFIAGSVSASSQFVRSRAFNKFHEFLLVDAAVVNATDVWTRPALRGEFLALRNRPLAFLTRCGDKFVRTITTGGELTAILDVTTDASEDTSSLTVSLNGDYAGASGQARLAEELKQRFQNHKTQVTVIRAGGLGALPTYSADQLVEASLIFPEAVAKHPVPMQAGLSSYDTIATPVALTVKQESLIGPLFRAYKRSMEIQGNLLFAQRNSGEFRVVRNSDGQLPSLDLLIRNDLLLKGDFTFDEIDKTLLAKDLDEQQAYTEKLELLARQCQESPINKCNQSVPDMPQPRQSVVRVFERSADWDTAKGPVDITLSSEFACKLENISGKWQTGSVTEPVLPCDRLPKRVQNGHVVEDGFDINYSDNVGTCTYHFLCTRR